MLPPELLQLLSSHARLAENHFPTLLKFDGTVMADSGDTHELLHVPGSEHPLALGNLFLSSCPGKKGTVSLLLLDNVLIFTQVRLHQLGDGRTTVCRDLWSDMKRIKAAGIRCIMWSVVNQTPLMFD